MELDRVQTGFSLVRRMVKMTKGEYWALNFGLWSIFNLKKLVLSSCTHVNFQILLSGTTPIPEISFRKILINNIMNFFFFGTIYYASGHMIV